MRQRAKVGESFSSEVTLDEDSIAEFARLSGDMNPLHHDREFARQSRFGQIIACGPQYASLLMGLAASHFSQRTTMLGLEFDLKFHRAVRAGETLHLRWEVLSVEWKESLRGDLVQLRGSVSTAEGYEVLTSTGTILLTDQP